MEGECAPGNQPWCRRVCASRLSTSIRDLSTPAWTARGEAVQQSPPDRVYCSAFIHCVQPGFETPRTGRRRGLVIGYAWNLSH